MTPAARTEAAIELVDAIIAAAREGGAAADTLIARYFGARRYAGSKDRRAVRELVYAAVRAAGEMPVNGRAALVALADRDPALAATFDGTPHGPAAVTADEPRSPRGAAPRWLEDLLVASGIDRADLSALVGRAPLDLRVNRSKATREQVLAVLTEAEPIVAAADGVRLPTGTHVEPLTAFRDGWMEVQDAGSQIVGLALPAEPGGRIVDLCAGAGGKTLAIADRLRGHGVVLACDTDRGRLSRLAPRAARAGATNIETRLLDPRREDAALADWTGTADGVLVDAPCSGTGTWRRNPEARWRLSNVRLERFVAAQSHVLDVGARLVRPGGSLAYVVCSLLDTEGAAQVDAFLARHAGWVATPLDLPAGRSRGKGVRLEPAHDATDGFFVARLVAPC